MTQASKRFISIAISLALVFAAIIVYFELTVPTYDADQKIKADEISENNFLNSEKSTIQAVENLISAYQGQGQIQQAVSMSLPTNEDVAGAIAQLYGIAEMSNLSVDNLSVSVSGASGVPAAPAAQLAALGGQGGQPSIVKPVGTVTLGLAASGPYAALKSFLDLAATNIRIFDVKQISVAPAAKSDTDLYSYGISLDAYYEIP